MAKSIIQDVFIDVKTRGQQDAKRQLADVGKSIKGVNTEVKDVSASIAKFNEDLAKKGPSAWGMFAKGIKSVAEVMAPLNQAFELGGKVIRVAEAGLEAYAKTSPAAAREVAALTQEFEGYKRAVMEATGETVAFVLKGTVKFDDLKSAAARMAETGESAADALAKVSRYGVQDVAKSFLAPLKSAENWWYTSGRDTFGSIADGFGTAAENAKKATIEAARWKAEMAALGGKLLGNESRSQRAIREGAADRAARQADIDREVNAQTSIEESQRSHDYSQDRYAAADGLRELQDALRSVQKDRTQTLFESMFGPVEEIRLYDQSLKAIGSTLSAVNEAVGAGYQALITGSAPIGEAMKKAAAASILASGTASAIDAARETALGFGSLAWGPIGGVAAAAHFKSAALHAAVAVGAGVVAKGLGAGPGTAAGSGASGSAPAVGGGSAGNGGTRTIVERTIVYADPFAEQSARERALTAERTWKRVSGGTFGSDS